MCREKNYRWKSFVNIDTKIPSDILANRLQPYSKKMISHDEMECIPRMQEWFDIRKLI